jgi:hypothetical protein
MRADTHPRRALRLAACGLVLTGVASVFFMSGASAASGSRAQASSGSPVREAQVFSEERTGVPSPVGLAFSTASSAFYVVAAQAGAPAEAEVVKLTPFDLAASDRAGSARIAAPLADPINMAFDARGNRLLLLGQAGELVEVQVGSGGDPDPATLTRRDIARFALADPQGVAVDPGSGTIFVLDAALPRIVRIEPDPSGGFDAATTTEIDLRSGGLGRTTRGLAFDPSTGHLHLGTGRNLVELTTSGAVVATRDLSVFALTKTEGMVFAPSGDQTDADSQFSLYVADSGSAPTGSSNTTMSAAPAPSAGQIMELSLAGAVYTASSDFTSSLVRTVNMGGLSPPSPDPSGITYVPSSDRLFISDGEVEEVVNGITHFQGANVWELNRSGAIQRTTNISNVPPTQVPITNEPVGTAFNPTNGHYYVSADDGKKVFDVNPGADGIVGTTGDVVTSFDTLGVGNSDPEGITFDTFGGHLFVADGLNREIYEYTTSGTLINHFDTAALGVEDPESVEFNPVSGTLFILSDKLNTPSPAPIIVETTTSGTLIQTIDASASNAVKPAGIAYAPASNGSGVKRFYIVDRGIDNNNDPNAVDGKLYEMSTPAAGPPTNVPPSVNAGTDQAITLPANANLDGTVTDDGLPAPPSLTTNWTQVSGPGTVTFGNASAVDTTASVTVGGIYVVRLTANDGQFAASDDVTLTFSGSGSVQSLDIPVVMGNDDAEESTANIMLLGNADLDLMTADESNLVVGTRFRNVTLPPGATISYAYLQLTAEETHTVATSLTIRGHAADNASMFTTVNADLSARPTTTASTAWTVAPWPTIGETGLAQRSPDIAGIIQEIVNRPGWASGNALVLLTRGGGTRVAESFNKTATPGGDPLLHVEYSTGPGNSPPQITSDGGGSTAARSVPENQTAVTDVDATDPDSGDTVTYSISGGADQAKFSIVPTTGVLSFLSAPNFESPTDSGLNNVYDVTVSASDGRGGSDSQAIAVTVLNLNEFAPGITSDGGGTSVALSRPENSTAVTDVNATDGDGDVLTYSISGGVDAALFTIVPTTGVLTFVTAPNFEAPTDDGTNNVYDVVVDASDGSLSDTQAIAVTVTDVPENPPVINSDGGGDTASVSVAENQTAVTDVDATDPDPGDTVTYSISGGADAAAFAISSSSGVLTFVSAPNFEAPTDAGGNNVYDVDVRASDGTLSDTQAIAVTVTDVPENPPAINSDGGGDTASVSVVENQTAVTDVDATDPDPGDTVTYSISGGADQAKFSIVPTTGVLTFVSAPNFEAPTDAGANNVYDVIVRASDGILFDTQAIAVTVTDVNENPTITSNGGGDTAAVSAPENQTAVTDVNANDPDAGTTLIYLISGGPDAARFAIDPLTGVLTFVTAPDFETPLDVGGNNVYDVTVQVSDGQGGSDAQAIAVTVTDVVEGSGSQLYFTLLNAGTPGGVSVADEDVVFFNGTTFSLAFDGSDVGIASLRIDSFSWVDSTRLLLSFDVPGTVPGIAGTTDDSDIVLFTSTSLGPVTAGTFSMYFDGSDVGLTTSGEDLDAVELLPNGRILVSTINTATVIGVTADDEDLMEFIPSSLGPVTAGTFSMYFDGTDVGLNTTNGEDVDAAAVDATGKIYLSTLNAFSVTGVSGADEDVFVFTPTTLGSSTTGTFSSTRYFDGSIYGLGANDVFAIDLP